MGLDMYLIKKKRTDKRKDLWDFSDGSELIYWRKANAIHRFLCDNGREIEQEVSYEISKNTLKELLNKCNKILDVAKTKKGCFFGSTDYNQWYLESIKKTKKELENVIDTIDWNNENVYYLASW